MNPVVPKIRVGDVLHGTKNLRSYLRTCSLVQYFKYMDRRYAKPKDAKSLLYTPHKGDQFVVCVNNHDRFAAWSPNKDVVLLFVNPTGGRLPSTGLLSRMRAPAESGPYMSPEIFPQWFIRTRGRNPDVKSWPKHAHYLWAALHMNAWRNPETSLQIHYGINKTEDIPFQLHQYFGGNAGGVDRSTLQHAVREAVQRGTFRNYPGKKQLKMGIRSPQVNVTGPCLEDLRGLRRQLDELMKNPRLMSKVKGEKEIDFSFLKNLQKNPQ